MSAAHPRPSWTRALSPLFLLPLALFAGVRAAKADCVDYSTYLHSLGGLKTASILRSIEVSGSLAYVAADSSGLMIMDISNPAAITIVGSVETKGPARDVKLAGNLAYVAATDSGLVVVDITNPANPVVVGWADTPGTSRGVALEGNYAYIADRDAGGLQVVDISDPAHPAVIGALDTPGAAYDVTVSNHRAYVADGDYGLQIIDVSTPSSPSLLGTADTPGASWDVFVADSLAYVADFASGLQIVNVSNPATPEIIGVFNDPGYYVYRVEVRDNLAFLARDLSGLQVVDISSPAAPHALGNSVTFMDALGVHVDGNRAYVVGFPISAGRPSGLEIFDITNPASAPATRWEPPAFAGFSGVTVEGNLAYVVGEEYSYLDIVDVSDHEAPTLVGIPRRLDFKPRSIAVSGGLACIGSASGFDSFQIFDVSNPASIVARGGIIHLPAWDIEIVGSYAYLADPYDTTGFKVIDISNPDAPSMVGHATGSPVALAIQGDLAYTADYDAGFKVIDITQPTSPAVLGSLQLPETPADVSMSGNYAYVADYFHGLMVIDVSDPTSPTLVGSVEAQGLAVAVEVADHIAYVADGLSLQMIDVLDPLHPAPVGSVIALGVKHLDVSGDYVYLPTLPELIIAPRPCALVVPVALSSFQAVPEPGSIVLRWTTPESSDLAGFHVHRSVAGGPFERITTSLIAGPGPYTFRDEHVAPEQSYAYRLEAVDRRGESTFLGPYFVSSNAGLVHNRLGISRPNPFRAGNISTRIDFDIARSARTTLRILDVTGAQVRVLLDAPLPAGSHFAMWDGKDERGRRAATGTYFYQLVSGSFSKTERLVVTR